MRAADSVLKSQFKWANQRYLSSKISQSINIKFCTFEQTQISTASQWVKNNKIKWKQGKLLSIDKARNVLTEKKT